MARRLGELPMMSCASPGYLKKFGTPRTLDDLDEHLVVHYRSVSAPTRWASSIATATSIANDRSAA
jgi:hypothetical protein